MYSGMFSLGVISRSERLVMYSGMFSRGVTSPFERLDTNPDISGQPNSRSKIKI